MLGRSRVFVRREPAKPCGASLLFRRAEQVKFHNKQDLDEEGLLGRGFLGLVCSARGERRDAWADRLKAVFHQFQRNGTVMLRYQTTIYVAQRNGG